MQKEFYQKPKKRSKLRLYFGKKYYTFKRYAHWYFLRNSYSKHMSSKVLPFVIFNHKTPLLRKLQGVDMELQYNKIINLLIASKKINSICIKPGEIFSFWKCIGKPTQLKGYKNGLVLNPEGTFGIIGSTDVSLKMGN